jgi:hypothetical protein
MKQEISYSQNNCTMYWERLKFILYCSSIYIVLLNEHSIPLC